jgi:hypothetical protein
MKKKITMLSLLPNKISLTPSQAQAKSTWIKSQQIAFFFFFHYTKEDDKQGTKRALEERQYKV